MPPLLRGEFSRRVETMNDTHRLLERLNRIEVLLESLVQQKIAKEWYSTGEVAEVLDKAEYTVREWCRMGQIAAKKAPNGRGWLISHDVLLALRNRRPPIRNRHNAIMCAISREKKLGN